MHPKKNSYNQRVATPVAYSTLTSGARPSSGRAQMANVNLGRGEGPTYAISDYRHQNGVPNTLARTLPTCPKPLGEEDEDTHNRPSSGVGNSRMSGIASQQSNLSERESSLSPSMQPMYRSHGSDPNTGQVSHSGTAAYPSHGMNPTMRNPGVVVPSPTSVVSVSGNHHSSPGYPTNPPAREMNPPQQPYPGPSLYQQNSNGAIHPLAFPNTYLNQPPGNHNTSSSQPSGEIKKPHPCTYTNPMPVNFSNNSNYCTNMYSGSSPPGYEQGAHSHPSSLQPQLSHPSMSSKPASPFVMDSPSLHPSANGSVHRPSSGLKRSFPNSVLSNSVDNPLSIPHGCDHFTGVEGSVHFSGPQTQPGGHYLVPSYPYPGQPPPQPSPPPPPPFQHLPQHHGMNSTSVNSMYITNYMNSSSSNNYLFSKSLTPLNSNSSTNPVNVLNDSVSTMGSMTQGSWSIVNHSLSASPVQQDFPSLPHPPPPLQENRSSNLLCSPPPPKPVLPPPPQPQSQPVMAPNAYHSNFAHRFSHSHAPPSSPQQHRNASPSLLNLNNTAGPDSTASSPSTTSGGWHEDPASTTTTMNRNPFPPAGQNNNSSVMGVSLTPGFPPPGHSSRSKFSSPTPPPRVVAHQHPLPCFPHVYHVSSANKISGSVSQSGLGSNMSLTSSAPCVPLSYPTPHSPVPRKHH